LSAGPILTEADQFHLEALRGAWKHFDGAMMLDRDHAPKELLEGLRAFTSSTIELKKLFEAFRRKQFLRRNGEPEQLPLAPLENCGVCAKPLAACPGHDLETIKKAAKGKK